MLGKDLEKVKKVRRFPMKFCTWRQVNGLHKTSIIYKYLESKSARIFL